jgi:hypothetical protein
MDSLQLNYNLLDEISFHVFAHILLNKSCLVVNTKKYRFVEIEFYLHGKNHKDKYVHCDLDQLLYGTFYFHKFKNGTYKAGTFKGMDITLGDTDTKTYFGILIRAIQDIDTDTIIEGPCNVVNRILAEYGCDSILEFTGGVNLNIFENDYNFIVKKSKKLEPEKIYIGPRIGLSDKFESFKDQKYRYAIYKNKIKKQKTKLIEIW